MSRIQEPAATPSLAMYPQRGLAQTTESMNACKDLLANLQRTYQALEGVRTEHSKEHERLSKSFDRAQLAVLHQEQTILNRVEDEHNQMKQLLASIQRSNEKALQESIAQVNVSLNRIAQLSSQLQETADSKNGVLTVTQVQSQMLDIFSNVKNISLRLKTVEFVPHLQQTITLGMVHTEDHIIDFVLPQSQRTGIENSTVVGGRDDGSMLLRNGTTENLSLQTTEAKPTTGTKKYQSWAENTEGSQVISHNQEVHEEHNENARPFKKLSLSNTGRTPSVLNNIQIGRGTSLKENIPNAGTFKAFSLSVEPSRVAQEKDWEHTDGNTDPSQQKLGRMSYHAGISSSGVVRAQWMDRRDHSLGRDGETNDIKIQPSKTSISMGDYSELHHRPQDSSQTVAAIDLTSLSPRTSLNEKQTLPSDRLPETKALQSASDSEGDLRSCDSTGRFTVGYSSRGRGNLSSNSIPATDASPTVDCTSIIQNKSETISKLTCHLQMKQSPRANLAPSQIKSVPVFSNTDDDGTVFKVIPAIVMEDESDSNDEQFITPESNMKTMSKDAMTCRTAAILASRVPSAKQNGCFDQLSQWTLADSIVGTSATNYSFQDTTLSPRSLSSDASVRGRQFGKSYTDARKHNKLPPTNAGAHVSIKLEKQSDSEPSPRTPSPTDSVKSSYTFIIDSPRSRNLTFLAARPYRKTSALSLTLRNPLGSRNEKMRCLPVIDTEDKIPKEKGKVPAAVRGRSSKLAAGPSERRVYSMRSKFASNVGKSLQVGSRDQYRKPIPRSSSMPVIQKATGDLKMGYNSTRFQYAKERRDSASSTSSCQSTQRSCLSSSSLTSIRSVGSRKKPVRHSSRPSPGNLQHSARRVRNLSKSESSIRPSKSFKGAPSTGVLIGQFGKFGSGRAELNLPSGIHVTPQGTLYVVDYGNKRIKVMDMKGNILQLITLQPRNYFDVAVNNKGLVVLTNSSDKTVEVYSKHGKHLNAISENFDAPRGVTVNFKDEFIITDMKRGTLSALLLDNQTGRRVERTIVPGFNKPYFVSTNGMGQVAVSERGFDGGCCVKILGENWQVLRVLGVQNGLGPLLVNPWGVCLDNEGNVLVADWGQTHSVILFPATQEVPIQTVVTEGLSSPRGLATLQDCHLVVADSMHNCIKVFQYQ
ncbi:uncharacterized protein LOC122803553 [Protopterus annectens]|uniref:uncharacterized protein LOC122803553 n=1 Tax=Protopterus annectens TaxID=7888 RepID=UPI001CFB608F|nr:uncharacterized protein LOC122803553 [Protopterus annectens]